MAKLALTLALFIAIFVFTHAKIPLDLPNEGSATIRDPSITLPEPESKRTIMLPSEKPESEPATVVELDLKEWETAVVDTDPEVEEMMEEEEENIPIAVTDMRLPVWERVDGGDERRKFVFRHPHHRCHHPHRLHHHHHRFYHQFDSQRPGPEVSYGNDMLVAEPEPEKMVDEDSTEAALPLDEISTEVRLGHGGGVRRAPSRWVRFHFGERPRFPDHGPHHHHHDEEEEHHHDRHHHDDEEDDEHRRDHHRDDQEEDEHRHRPHDEGDMLRKRPFRHGRREEGGGLVKRIRKFLHQFE